MDWYRLEVGIEHLTTGLCLGSGRIVGCGFQFEMSSPSVFTVWSDAPFTAYWPTRECHLAAVQSAESPSLMRCSASVADFAANVVAAKLREAWTLKDTEGEPLPQKVADAIIRKFGAAPIPEIHRGYPYYWFTYANMFHGVEPDGYIHT